ncbi:unnamed protein product [Urochloa decumbens]|uniref:GLTSCR protein conserved domain-containing protein n=1 Tax=Urochloa decumbens TaxID=240449 RepID=A0ABC8WCK7_9POAL
MEDGGNPTAPPTTSTAAAAAAAAQHQHQQQLQRQLFLMQQQAQAQGQPHPQQLSQQAMSRFPSNIDAHLRPLGPLRFHQPQQQPQPQPQPQPSQPPHSQGPSPSPSQGAPQQSSPHQQQQQQQAAAAAQAQAQAQAARVRSPEMEMALQDAMRVCNPDIKTPFQSIEDAVNRLLAYHVVADYEAEEDDRILDSDTSGQIPSRLQQWDHNILIGGAAHAGASLVTGGKTCYAGTEGRDGVKGESRSRGCRSKDADGNGACSG